LFGHLIAPSAISRQTLGGSESDSDYGSRSKKKKRLVPRSESEVRLTSRGGKMPDYREDAGYGSEFDEVPGTGQDYTYYVNPESIQPEEEGEIEAVLNHTRDETLSPEKEDSWTENIVSYSYTNSDHQSHSPSPAFPYQMERIFPSPQYGRSL
jgi:chromodomain-helicase-DNA-binding protein 1